MSEATIERYRRERDKQALRRQDVEAELVRVTKERDESSKQREELSKVIEATNETIHEEFRHAFISLSVGNLVRAFNKLRAENERKDVALDAISNYSDWASSPGTVEQCAKIAESALSPAEEGDDRLEAIRSDALGEVYGGKLDFGHVGTGDFIRWVKANPMQGGHQTMAFDLVSVMGMFEDWVKAAEEGKEGK